MIDDPIELLRTHVRRQADAMGSTTSVDELIAHITLEHDRRPASSSFAPAARPPRRWSSFAIGLALAVGVGTGAVVTAAVLDRAPVVAPELGVFCRTSLVEVGSGILTESGPDPVATCRSLWESGELTAADAEGQVAPGTSPPLIACTGSREVLEVLPAFGGQSCTDVGLADADIDGMAANPRVELGDRVGQINSMCLPPADARDAALAVFDDMGLQGWTVEVGDGVDLSAADVCGLLVFEPGGDQTLSVITTSRS